MKPLCRATGRVFALLGALALSMAQAAHAQSAVNGQALYVNVDPPATLSCKGCHGDPPTGLSAALLPTAISANLGGMGMFSFFTSSQLADIEAYITNPSAAAAPAVSLSPASLAFTSQEIGTTSAAQTVTLTNTGTGALTLSGVAASAPFVQTNGCGASVAAGASCTIQVSFAPTATGAASGTLSLTDNASGSPQSVTLTGTGTPVPAPAVTLAPTSLAFGSVAVGSTSAAQMVTLTNTGTAPLSISSIAASSGFAQTNACGATLAAGASCTISVTFSPAAASAATGTLTVTDNAAGASQAVTLLGMGTPAPAPSLSLSPSSLAFGSQTVGTGSMAQAITLSNTGNAAMSIASITAPAGFTQTSTCGASLAAGASCTVSVSFAPTAVSAYSGNVTVNDNAAGSPHAVAVSGSGTAAPAPAVTLSANNLAFGSQNVGVASAPQSLTVSNTGTAALMLSSLTVSGDFAQTGGTCTASGSVAASSSCSIQVSFTPTATGARSGTLTIADNATGSPRTVTLQGTGTTATVAGPTLTPSSLDFGSQAVNTASNAKTVTLANPSGSPALSITGIAITGAGGAAYSQTSDCGASLSGGASCSIQVVFAPASAGSQAASVSVASNAAGPLAAALTGIGVAPSTAVLGTSTSTLSFGSRTVGSTSRARMLTLSNTGTATLHFGAITVTGDFARAQGGCGATLAAHSSCSLWLTFTPTAPGTRAGSVTIASDASNGNVTVALTGTGTTATTASVAVAPASLTFPTTPVGTASAALAVSLTNDGTAPLTIGGVSVQGHNGGDFAATSGCFTLAAGASCVVDVTFTPSASGSRTGRLVVSVGTTTGVVSVPLSGTGQSSGGSDDGGHDDVHASTTTLSFQPTAPGTTSAPLSALVTNSSTTSTATLSQVRLSGSGFALAADQCSGRTLAPQASCGISVNFTPTAGGTATGAVSVSTTAGTTSRISMVGASTTATTESVTVTGASGGGGAAAPWLLPLLGALALLRRRKSGSGAR